jgi:signal transduction histidine kinase
MIENKKAKISLQQWFQLYGRRPLVLATLAISLFFVIQITREIVELRENQKKILRQSADIISLGLAQKNRPLVESVLEALRWQIRAGVVVLCSDSKPIIASGANGLSCSNLEVPFSHRMIETEISGFKSYRVVAIVPMLGSGLGSLAPFGLALFLVGYFLRTMSVVQKRIRLDILNPLEENASDKESAIPLLEIDRIESLRRESTNVRVRAAVAEAIMVRSEQVAHDVRSPLAALEMALKNLSAVPAEQRSLIGSAVNRISEIANDLLSKSKKPIISQDLVPVIGTVVREKQSQFSELKGIKIEIASNCAMNSHLAKVNPAEFNRVLSNLINNAVESMDAGRVFVSIFSSEKEVFVRVKDTGKGIPALLLGELGARGLTYGKNQIGTGLGLFHAKTTIEGWGGRLNIESEVEKGTTVTVSLPRVRAESGSSRNIFLLDDDLLNHQVWQMAAKRHDKHLICFSKKDELIRELSNIPLDAQIYLDSHLEEESQRGEEIAKELFDLGYRELFLTTGYDAQKFLSLPWIKGVIGKQAPWAFN